MSTHKIYIDLRALILSHNKTIHMRKILVLLAGGFLFTLGCNKSSNHDDGSLPFDEETFTATQRKCAADEVLQEQLKTDAALRGRMDQIEEFTRRVIKNPNNYRLLTNGIIEIPVVVNVLYRTNAQNVSPEQIQTQIDVLNNDFSATNSDYNLTSTYNGVKSGMSMSALCWML